jgi:hypothetical protein
MPMKGLKQSYPSPISYRFLAYIFDIIIPIGIIFPDCIMDIIDIMGIIPDTFVGIITVIDLFISMPIGTMTIMEVFIPVAFMTFMGIIFIDIWDCIIIPDAFMGIITIMGTIFMQVMLAGQAFIMGFIAVLGAFIGIIAMQFIPVGHVAIMGCIIFPEFIISPAMGSIAAIVTIPINARSMADVILLDVVI